MLPALLAVLLVVLLTFQFVLPPEAPSVPDLPPSRGGKLAQLSDAADTGRDPILAERSIFTPVGITATPGEGARADAPPLPLDGAVPVGIVRVRGAARLLLQSPEGRSVTLRPGQSYRGWRLTGIGQDNAQFRRGGETIRLEVGAAAGFAFPPAYTPPNFSGEDDNAPFRFNQADEQ